MPAAVAALKASSSDIRDPVRCSDDARMLADGSPDKVCRVSADIVVSLELKIINRTTMFLDDQSGIVDPLLDFREERIVRLASDDRNFGTISHGGNRACRQHRCRNRHLQKLFHSCHFFSSTLPSFDESQDNFNSSCSRACRSAHLPRRKFCAQISPRVPNTGPFGSSRLDAEIPSPFRGLSGSRSPIAAAWSSSPRCRSICWHWPLDDGCVDPVVVKFCKCRLIPI